MKKDMIKHPIFLVKGLVVIALLTVGLKLCAKTSKMPKGKFVSYHYTRGGGMNPLDRTVYHLRYDEEAQKSLLTISGDCEGEEITVEVGQEVFDRCLQLIEEHKLYRSKGYYKPTFIALDAPSDGFSIVFKDPYQTIDGSGNMPSDIRKGLSAIHAYFKSVVGDRKAEGHVDRLYDIKDVAGFQWTDGVITLTTPKGSADPLKVAARQLTDPDASESDIREMGFERFHDGDQHYLVVHDYRYNRSHLFLTFDGKESTLKQMALRDQASLLCGTFTDGNGRQYIFTADGKCIAPGATEARPFISFSKAGGTVPEYYFGNKKVGGYKLTPAGADIIGADGKVVSHLTRVVEGNDKWDVVNKRFLSRTIIDSLTDEQLKQMIESIFKPTIGYYSNLLWYTDIGGVNVKLLQSEIDKRNASTGKPDKE